MRVLAVGAHPDDLEILCAGTLAKFKKNGAKIFMVHLCNGNKGHFEIPAVPLARMRAQEAKNSAKILQAECLGPVAPDLELYRDKPTMDKVIDIVRKTKPDLIITHSPDDYMCDHTVTSQLVVDASFMASLPNYKLHPHHTGGSTPVKGEGLRLSSPPPLRGRTEEEGAKRNNYVPVTPVYFMDTVNGINFQPTEYVDITKFIKIKEKMLLCHISQAKWLKEHDNLDYVELMRKQSSFRGLQCGVKFAEGFRLHYVSGRVRPERLLP